VFQLTPWSIVPLAAAAIALAAFLRARPQDQIPGGHALRFLFLTLFIWSAAQALSSLLARPQAIILAAQLAYLGIAFTPVAWFVFAMTYSQRVRKISRFALNAVSIVPGITLVLALTNPLHGLVWSETAMVYKGGFVGLVTQHGMWFYVHAVYSYSLLLVATAILGFALTQHRQHHQSLLAAMFAPIVALIANLYYLSPLNPYPWLDFTTLGFVAGVLILDKGILRRGLLNTPQIARDRVVEQLKDPVLVLASDGSILDANQSAVRAWDVGGGLLGTEITRLIPHLTLEVLTNPVSNSEVTIGQRAYEISSTLLDQSNPQTDVAIVFRDATERRKAQRDWQNLKVRLERMAHTDALTHMYNRRYFMARLNEEFERVRRHGSTLSVLVFDLDHFKRINDTYGHDSGDVVLVAVADVVNQIKRMTDIACRLGGEEFALLLPETSKAGAINLAQRLRRGIEEYPYRSTANKSITVTASIGVATVTANTREPEAILKIADRALYRAKGGGRNMVCVDNDSV